MRSLLVLGSNPVELLEKAGVRLYTLNEDFYGSAATIATVEWLRSDNYTDELEKYWDRTEKMGGFLCDEIHRVFGDKNTFIKTQSWNVPCAVLTPDGIIHTGGLNFIETVFNSIILDLPKDTPVILAYIQ